jgi:DNA-binding HxlR family transcriptional regulator
VLTPDASKKKCYDQWTPDARALDLVGDKWTLLIVRDLLAGPVRFVNLQRRLPGISTEQLRSRLTQMVASGLLTKQRYRESPPRVDYELTEAGYALAPVIAALANWGHQWAWDEPHDGEEVNITAYFRSCAHGISLPEGSRVALVAAGEAATLVGHTDHCEIADGVLPDLRATISGSGAGWLDALNRSLAVPAYDLTIKGDSGLAAHVLVSLLPKGIRPRQIRAA